MTIDQDNDEAEIREVLRARVRAIEPLSWEELDRFEKTSEQLNTKSGNSYRVTAEAFWDMGEWESRIEIYARAYPATGCRRWWPYKETGNRGGPTDPVGTPPLDWKPRRRFARWRRRT